jgi:hypothetical protein
MELSAYWTQTFGDALPLADTFRDLHAARWVRFHSLPKSKRYPETEAEYAIVLHRHNLVVSELAHEGAILQLITTNWSAHSEPNGPPAEIAELGISTKLWRSVGMHNPADATEDARFLHLYASSIPWKANCIDSVFRLAADDRIFNLMLLDTGSSWMVHPYDGGIDVILRSKHERDALARKYKSWLSPREDGL